MTTPDPAAPKTEASTTEPPAAAAPSLDAVIEEVFGPQETPAEQQEPPAAETAAAKKPEEARDERVATRLAAAKRAEMKAATERRDLQAKIEAQERRAAELDSREKRIRLIEEDPIRAFEEFKLDPKAFLEKLAGEHKPENVVAKKTTALEQKVADLEKQLADRVVAEKTQAARIQADGAWKEASAAFLEHVGNKAEAYRHLVEEFTEEQAADLAFSVLTEAVARDKDGRAITRSEAYYREFGAYPDNDVIAEYLDSIAKARIEARSKSAWRKRGESATQASQAQHGDPKPVPTGRGTSPRTLTSREASQRVAPPARKGGLVWTAADQAEADETALRLIEEAMRRTG